MRDSVLSAFMKANKSLKAKVKRVYLFGSRARGDERPDSDYDLLLIARDDFSQPDKEALYDRVMDVLLQTGRLVSLKIFKEAEFQRLRRLKTPFIEKVLSEGIRVG